MKILLVDDERESRHYVARFLIKWGHDIREADHGAHAVEILDREHIDLVLSDIRMPVMNGLELLKTIRSMNILPPPEVVLFTAFSEVQTAIEALRGGACDYILKPVDVRELLAVIERVGEHLALVRENTILTKHFDSAIACETRELKEQLEKLKKEYYEIIGIGQIVVQSEAMKKLYETAGVLAQDRTVSVLIEGETGTGKELIARYIHMTGDGHERPLVDINCAAIPPGLFESELFGYESGSFTGAFPKGKKGKMDMAQGGSLFLDEITEMPVEMQAKLLRVIQDRSFFRVGGLKKVDSDVRLICATNADMQKQVEEGFFRKDLFYRLSTAQLRIPPLRERPEDIVPLASLFLDKYAQQKKKSFRDISPACMKELQSHSWPGNVRELQNTIEYAVLMYDGIHLEPGHILLAQPNADSAGSVREKQGAVSDWFDLELPEDTLPLEDVTNHIIIKALTMHGGNKTRTASYLGLSLRALSYRLKQIQ